MNKRISHILILLLLLSVSCTYNWHREFLLGKKAEIPTAQNWRLKIDLFAYKNVAGDEMPRTPNDYYFSIRCFNANKKDGPLIDIYIDSLTMIYYPMKTKSFFTLKDSFLFSSNSEDEFKKCFYFHDNVHVYIPEDVDSVEISFDAKYFKVTSLREWVDPDYPPIVCDSFYVADSTVIDIMPYRIMMYRHESKTKIPAFFIW